MLRLDKRIVEDGLVESRSKAVRLIENGVVRVNGTVCSKPAQLVDPTDTVMVDSLAPVQFLSQGGDKLRKALTVFSLDLTGRRVLDIGASTGGFTDCALQHGAKEVYAVDVGTGQLHPALLQDPRIHSIEQQDIRTTTLQQLGGIPFEVALCDVSFISLTHILPHVARLLMRGGEAICLVKPQFEVGPHLVNRHGIVTKLPAHVDALRRVCDCACLHGLSPIALTYSPIGGRGRNTEYLLHLRLGRERVEVRVESIVREASESLA